MIGVEIKAFIALVSGVIIQYDARNGSKSKFVLLMWGELENSR